VPANSESIKYAFAGCPACRTAPVDEGVSVTEPLRAVLSFLFVAAVAAVALFPFVVLADVLSQHRSRWRVVRRSKTRWALIVLFGSYVGATAYLLVVRRDLLRSVSGGGTQTLDES